MHFRLVALFLIASLCSAQSPTAIPSAAGPATPGAPSVSVTVPQGTTIALTLVSSIRSKTTKPGDTVRAMVAFPVTVGTQLAIPAGTYVEGTVNAVNAHPQHSGTPSVQLHFTRLLFSNGYSAPLDASNTQAMLISPEFNPQPVAELADARDGAPMLGEGFGGPAQNPPTMPPFPHVGPNPAVVVGATIGGTALLLVLAWVVGHRHMTNTDYVLFDGGWQFQIALQQPLTLDAGQVAAAAEASPMK